MVVKIGEDATCLVKRVDYDSKTDQLVGFVLPRNKIGLPLQNAKVANNALGQSLCDSVPTFCFWYVLLKQVFG